MQHQHFVWEILYCTIKTFQRTGKTTRKHKKNFPKWHLNRISDREERPWICAILSKAKQDQAGRLCGVCVHPMLFIVHILVCRYKRFILHLWCWRRWWKYIIIHIYPVSPAVVPSQYWYRMFTLWLDYTHRYLL